ncbi:MAG: hypothetical protein KDA38_16005, partial [Planctomycetales bacterium]|nr:hypothetical protein [Planctomycetales bacterium]
FDNHTFGGGRELRMTLVDSVYSSRAKGNFMKQLSWSMACLALIGLLSLTAGCGSETKAPKKRTTASSSSEDGGSTDTTESNTTEGDTTEPAESTDASTTAAETTPAETTGEPTEAGYGHLKGRFVYGGTGPVPEKVNVNKDVEFCTQKHPVDESLLVNDANQGLSNVVVALYVGRGDKAPEPHPSYAEPAEAELLLDNAFCRFEPHVLVVQTGHKLTIGNSDPVGHNTNAALNDNAPFNDLIPAGSKIEKTFDNAEPMPAPVSCSIHPWMKGYLVVKDHPYVAVTDADGNFEIQNIPDGKWTFQVWHEKPSYITEATVKGKKEKWSKGRVELTIKNGTTDLGDISIDPSVFK